VICLLLLIERDLKERERGFGLTIEVGDRDGEVLIDALSIWERCGSQKLIYLAPENVFGKYNNEIKSKRDSKECEAAREL